MLAELPGVPSATDRDLAARLAALPHGEAAGVARWLRQVREAAGASETVQRRVLDEAITAYGESLHSPPLPPAARRRQRAEAIGLRVV